MALQRATIKEGCHAIQQFCQPERCRHRNSPIHEVVESWRVNGGSVGPAGVDDQGSMPFPGRVSPLVRPAGGTLTSENAPAETRRLPVRFLPWVICSTSR